MRVLAPPVLVVEDETIVAMLIEDMVSELAYEVAGVVPRLEDPMRLLDTEIFDITLLDVHLNGKTVFVFATAYGAGRIPKKFQGHAMRHKLFARWNCARP